MGAGLFAGCAGSEAAGCGAACSAGAADSPGVAPADGLDAFLLVAADDAEPREWSGISRKRRYDL